MARIKLSSADWQVRPKTVSRGEAAATAATLPGLPEEFLTDGSSVDDEVVLQPRPAARGAAPPSSAVDLSCELGPGEAAVLAVRHPSGALTFHIADQVVSRTRGGPAVAHFTVPAGTALPESTSRGLVGQAVKAILVKVTDAVVDKAVSLALPKLVELFETSTWKKKGLQEGWLKVTAASLAAKALLPGRPTSAERSLLFVHGTFSNAASAFQSLAKSDFFTQVAPVYGDRIFAFDHFSLSRTPEENARMLLEGLPVKAPVFDVVTHSRGGLVLRNLVERAAALGPLAPRFQFGRVVLVASPNEGTPLATPRRWEDTVGWMANLIELFPDNPFTTGAAFVANGLVWLARHASGDLPGISAMDGDGSQIATLQEPPGPPADRYSALVANFNPSGQALTRLLDAGLDQFFASANDLVVPSEGGWRVDRSGSSFIPGVRIGCFGPGGNLPGDAVTHVNIFAQPGAAPFLVRALTGQAQQLSALDPARGLPDRRLLRAGAAGVAAPVVTSSVRPVAARRTRITGTRAPEVVEAARPGVFSITVVNGDLSFERHPLLVGHYRSTQLTGAEAFIDRMTDKAMSRSLGLGVYPVEPGTNQVFLNRFVDASKGWLTPRPEAVIVAGLGQEGSLRPGELAHTVRQAVIAWAQRVAEMEPRTTELDLACTLIGSGGSGITAAQSAVLIAQGVSDANSLLARKDSGLPHMRDLRLIELYTDRASEAWRALRMQADATPGRFVPVEPIAAGTGPLLRPLESGYRGAAYDYIVATTRSEPLGGTAIEYSLDTRRARTEVRAQVAQARLLESLVKEASSAGSLDPNIGRTLFKLLVPVELEAFLADARETQIVLDEGTAGIPWELLDDEGRTRDDERPWAIKSRLLRKFKTETFRAQVTDASAGAPILVIGEPASPPEYPPLPGAYREAMAVYELLSAPDAGIGSKVMKVMAEAEGRPGPDARTVVSAVLEQNWRVVHVAGHGAPPATEGGSGGVVLSDGTFLGPAEINAMRVVPQLVFVNCCHLGAFASKSLLYDRVRFASGVARMLIDIGVRCVVAAGWAVDDDAASAFAETFYKALLRKERFVDAVAEAREAAFEFDGNTWAAYQCYGDPDWRLVGDAGGSGAWTPLRNEFQEIGSVTGLKLALRTLIVQSTYQQFDGAIQRTRLQVLEKRWQAMKWTVADRVGELFAQAYAAAGDTAEAIRWYDLVLQTSDSGASVRVYEQRSNLRIRAAWRAVETATAAAKGPAGEGQARGRRAPGRRPAVSVRALAQAITAARSIIRAETRSLSRLTVFGHTAERENLLGSAMKRLAMVEAAAGHARAERQAIAAMKKYYQQALERQRKAGGTDVFYSASNVIVAELALGAGRHRIDPALFAEARAGLRAKEIEGPDFWSVVGETELRLYEAIANGELAKRQRAVITSYRDLAGRVQGSSQWSSVYDTANFVLSKYLKQTGKAKGEAAAGAAILEYLRSRIPPPAVA